MRSSNSWRWRKWIRFVLSGGRGGRGGGYYYTRIGNVWEYPPRGGFVSSGFSENNCLWGLLSLAGSQNLAQVDLILYLPEADYCYLPIKRPFPSCLKPLFQREAKCGAIDMKMSFYSHAMKLIITRKVWNLASFWKWGFLELRNCLFHCHFITLSFTIH